MKLTEKSAEDEPKLIGLHVKALSNMIRRHLDATCAAAGVGDATGTHGMIIHFLYERQGQLVYQRDVEAVFHIRRATATRTLQLMEQNGLIYREPDPDDARLKRLYLTSRAIEMHETFGRCLRACEAHLQAGLTQEELDQFLTTMHKLKQNLAQE